MRGLNIVLSVAILIMSSILVVDVTEAAKASSSSVSSMLDHPQSANHKNIGRAIGDENLGQTIRKISECRVEAGAKCLGNMKLQLCAEQEFQECMKRTNPK